MLGELRQQNCDERADCRDCRRGTRGQLGQKLKVLIRELRLWEDQRSFFLVQKRVLFVDLVDVCGEVVGF